MKVTAKIITILVKINICDVEIVNMLPGKKLSEWVQGTSKL